MPIRGGDDGFAGAERVGERAGDDLALVQVGRDVDIGGADEIHELGQIDEAVVEDDVLFDAEIFRETLEAEAIVLAVFADEVRVGGTEDEVNCLREFGDKGGQGVEDLLDALVGREESEREQNLAALDGEKGFKTVGLLERDVVDAVRDNVDFFGGGVVDFAEKTAGALGHDDEAGGGVDQGFHDATLFGGRIAQDGVQRGDDGHL